MHAVVPRLDCRLCHDLSERRGAIDRAQAAEDADVRKIRRLTACERCATDTLVDPSREGSIDGGTLVFNTVPIAAQTTPWGGVGRCAERRGLVCWSAAACFFFIFPCASHIANAPTNWLLHLSTTEKCGTCTGGRSLSGAVHPAPRLTVWAGRR